MANPIETLKKLRGRSFKEIRVRGEQAIAVSAERIGLSGKLPSNAEFESLIEKDRYFGGVNPTAEMLMAAFYEQGETAFFQSFADKEKTIKVFRAQFGDKHPATALILEKAERIIEGRFDLLGYENLNFGGEHVDWHYEPLAGKSVPLRHWKQFDELSTEETGDKKIIWELNRHQHFFTLGAAYWLSGGDERYAETFARHLDDWILQNPPGMGVNWMSSLEVALRAISWIWAFRFFKNSPSLTPTLFHNALRYLFLHGRHIEKYLSTYYSPNTHLTGEALGLYYLGSQFRFFTRSRHWRDLGAEILLDELDRQIYPDGVYFEQSTWYQRYTADFYTHFLVLKTLDEQLESGSPAAGNDQKPQSGKLSESLQRQLDFLMCVTRPDGTTPLIGDDDGGRSLPLGGDHRAANDFRYLLATGAVLFKRRDYKFVAGDFSEETLWLLGAESAAAFDDLKATRPRQTSRGFTNGGYFVMRDGWAKTDSYLLIDGGNMGALAGGHSHADALSIEYAPGGKTLLVDPGTYTYHESLNLRDYFRSTMAHNTLSVGNRSSSEPDGKFSWQTKARTQVKSWIDEQRFDFFEAAHDGYERLPETPLAHTRSVLFLKNDYCIIRDFAETVKNGSAENAYQLNFHFEKDTAPTIESGEIEVSFVAETSAEKTGMRLFTFGDNGGWHQKNGWVSDCYGKRVGASFLRYLSRGVGAQEFFTFLLPIDSAFAQTPEVVETKITGGRLFVINYRNYRDLFVFGDGELLIGSENFESDFRFFWSRASLGETLPEEFVMIDGTRLVLGGKEIINHQREERLRFATARRYGNQVNIRTAERIFKASL